MAETARPLVAAAPAVAIEGHNCWRRPHAERASFLADAAAYFAAFAEAVERAQRSIMILGWDVDSRTRLHPERGRSRRDRLGSFLNSIVSRRRDLHAYVLDWDFAMIYALEREVLPVVKLDRRTHRRLRFRLDDDHPLGGSQHQKIVVIDDAVAFSGGLDLTIRRWDRPSHEPHDPLRVDHRGVPYEPFHDVQMLVDGNAARALGDLARERWERLTGERLSPPQGDFDAWPSSVEPDVRDVQVAISRTDPPYRGRPEIREVETLYLDAIAAARSWIYIENQYFTSQRIAAALGARLAESSGPEVVLVGPCRCTGWLEQRTMGVLRDQFIAHLTARDLHGRLRCVYPQIDGREPCRVFVHSKVFIADDALLRIGSANLSNRSLGLDTECDLTIEAEGREDVACSIAAFRSRLLGEYLGAPPSRVDDAVRHEGSLIRGLQALNGGPRRLVPIEAEVEVEGAPLPRPDVFDPERPMDPDEFFTRIMPEEARSPRPVLKLVALVTLLGGLALAWRYTPLAGWIDAQSLEATARWFDQLPLTPLLVVGAFVLLSLLMVPLTLLVVQAGLVFGPWWGLVYAASGSLVSALLAFLVGRRLGRDTLRRIAGKRLNRLARRVSRRGVIAVAALRLLPVAPFTIVNIVAGAARIGVKDFCIGTLVGMLPGIVALTVFAERLAAAIRRPSPLNVTLVVLVVLACVAGSLVVLRRLNRGDRARDADGRRG